MTSAIEILNSELNLSAVFTDLVLQEECWTLCEAVAGDSQSEIALISSRI
jgi:hypothetical protein